MRPIFLSILLLITVSLHAQNLVIVVIDGARYSETFGDENSTYIPYMAGIAEQGTILTELYNEHNTWTSSAIPALWTGSWDGSYTVDYQGNTTQATYSPSIFEYFRKQTNSEATNCYYVLKYVSNLWLQSFHPDYGPDYWPEIVCSGASDDDVLTNTLQVIENDHPQLLWVYLADVDHYGHLGVWNDYTASIQNADEIVNTLWTTLQNDPNYQNTTTMLVTNDHGRHDDAHGGFTGHGCSCEGCQHIMFLAVGPNIKVDEVSTVHHELADVAVTASELLDVNPEYSTGELIPEIFKVLDIEEIENHEELFVSNNIIYIQLPKNERITLEIFDITGRKIETIAVDLIAESKCSFNLSGTYKAGIYIAKLRFGDQMITYKFVVL
jgi:hypothetical protein